MKKTILALPRIGSLVAVGLAVINSKRQVAILGGIALLAFQTVDAQMLINGAGATFPYPIYSKWFETTHKVDPIGALQLSVHRLRRWPEANYSSRPWISALPTAR